jgi:endo-1,4-beta-xylanase
MIKDGFPDEPAPMLPADRGTSAPAALSFNRRRVLASAAATITSLAPIGSPAAGPANGLASLAAERGLYFGTAVQMEQLQGEDDLREAVLRECSIFTPEVALNWASLEPARGQLTLARMDDLATFTSNQSKKLQGHNLLWHRTVPRWGADMLRGERNWRPINLFFASVIPRYAEVISGWNVVNEPIDVGQRSDGLRNNVFLEVFGPDYIRRALEEARAFAPHAQLFISDYSLEYDFPVEAERRRLFLKLVEGLKKAGAPLDGVGLQSHLDLAKGSISTSAVSAFVAELRQLGLTVAVTELDVKEVSYTAPRQVRDTLVGDGVRRYLDVVLANPSVVGVTTWGLSDRHSWLDITATDYARFPEAWANGDGPGVNRGLPFDTSMQPKPMYLAIEQAIRAAPRRPADAAGAKNRNKSQPAGNRSGPGPTRH